MDVSVILPTYNESKNIVPLVEAIHKELGLFSQTPLNIPIAVYMGVCTVCTLE